MRPRAALLACVAAVWLAAFVAPAGAVISLLGLKNSLVQFALRQISVEGEFEISAEAVVEPDDGATELVGVTIADGDGVWFRAEAFTVRWRPRRILRGELAIDELTARGVEVLRSPAPPEVTVNEDAEIAQGEGGFFDWPRAPLTVRVDRLAAERVSIAPGIVSGAGIAFDAEGSARDEGDEQALVLNLRRIDEVEGRIALDYLRDFAAGTLRLKLDADEAAGGIVADIAGLPPDAASRVTLDADGPLTDWRLALDLEAERMLTARGRGRLHADRPFALVADFTITPGPEVDPRIAAALGDAARITVDAAEGDDGRIEIRSGAITAPALNVVARGFYQREDGSMDFDLQAEALQPLADLIDGADFARVGFTGGVAGTLDALGAEGELTLEGLATEPVDVGAAELDVAVRRDGAAISADIDGVARRMRLDRLGPDLLDEARLTVRGGWDGAEATLRELKLDAPVLTISADGEATPGGEGGGAGSARLGYSVATPDLGAVAAAYDVDAAGKLAMTGAVEGPLSAPRLTGDVAFSGLAFEGEDYGEVKLIHDVTVELPAGEGEDGPQDLGASGRIEISASGGPAGPARATADFALAGDALTLDAFTAEILEARASGRAEVNLATMLADGALTLDAPRLAAFSELAGEALEGAARAEIALSVRDGAQDARMEIEADGVRGFGAAVEALTLTADAQDVLGSPSAAFEGRVNGAEAAGFAVAAAEFTGEGVDMTGSGAAGRVDATVEGVEAAEQGVRIARATLSAEGEDFAGAPKGRATLTVEDASAPEFAVGRAVIEAEGEDLTGAAKGRATVTAEAIEAAGVTVARAVLEAEGEDLIAAPMGRAFLTAEEVAAEGATIARVEAEIDGKDLIAAPSATAIIVAEEIAAEGVTVARVKVDAEGEDLIAAPKARAVITAETIEAAGVTVARVTANIDGEDLLSAPIARLTATVEDIAAGGATVVRVDLEAEGENLLAAPKVRASATAETIAAPGVTVARATVEAEGEDLIAAPKVSAKATAERISAGGATIARVEADGRGENLLSDPALEAEIRASAIAVPGAARLDTLVARAEGRLSALAATLTGRGRLEDGGALAIDVAAAGDFSDPIAAEVTQLRLAAGEIVVEQRGPLKLRVENGATSIEGLDVSLPGGGLTGAVASRQGGMTGELALSLSDLRPLAKLVDAPLDAGALTMEATFDTAPGSAGAKLDAHASNVVLTGVPVDEGKLDLKLDAGWDGRTLDADAALGGPFGEPLRLRARMPMQANGGFPSPSPSAPLDASLTWEGQIDQLWSLLPLPDHVLTGRLDVDLRIVGTLSSPAPSGSLSLTDGLYQNLVTGTILTDLRAGSSLPEGGGIEIDLSAEDGSGGAVNAKVTVSGDQLVAGLSTKGAVLVRRDDVVAAISADIAAKGPLVAPAVTGTVTVDRAEVRLVDATPPSVADLGEVEIKGEPRPEAPPPSDGGGPTLDISITAPGNIFVRGRGLDSEWGMDLKVDGPAANPRVVGAIERKRGRFMLIGREFTLERGEIRFTGARPPDPSLDVALEREANGIVGGVAVRGFASRPEIAMESRPSLPEEEVLPRLLFGRSSQSLSGVEALQIAAGVAALTSGGEGALGGVRSAAGLDVLTLDTGDSGGTAVKAGSNISEGVYVGVRQALDGSGTSIDVEVEVFENFIVDSETNSLGSSLGVRWKKDF